MRGTPALTKASWSAMRRRTPEWTPTQDAALLPFTTKVCQKCELQGHLCSFKSQNVTSVVSGNLLGRCPKPDCTFIVPIWGWGLICLQPSPCHDIWHHDHAFCLIGESPYTYQLAVSKSLFTASVSCVGVSSCENHPLLDVSQVLSFVHRRQLCASQGFRVRLLQVA